MTAPIALQLYTLRQDFAQDFEGTLKKVAGLGYTAVETAGFPGTTPAKAAALFKDLGLAVPAAHLPLPVGDRKNEVLDTLATLGCTYCVSMLGADDFSSVARIRQSCDLFNEAHAAVAPHGFKFAIHNHEHEFSRGEGGQLAYDVMREHLEPAVLFELDVYWIQTAGVEPAAVVRQAGPRAPLLHVKDGPARRGEPMVALGAGSLDLQAILAAGQGHTEWLIVELDECATDMLAAVETSYIYLSQRANSSPVS